MEFEMNVYNSMRSNNTVVREQIRIRRISSGWDIRSGYENTSVKCDKTGAPELYKLLDNQVIRYPHDLALRMENLWDRALRDDEYIDEFYKLAKLIDNENDKR